MAMRGLGAGLFAGAKAGTEARQREEELAIQRERIASQERISGMSAANAPASAWRALAESDKLALEKEKQERQAQIEEQEIASREQLREAQARHYDEMSEWTRLQKEQEVSDRRAAAENMAELNRQEQERFANRQKMYETVEGSAFFAVATSGMFTEDGSVKMNLEPANIKLAQDLGVQKAEAYLTKDGFHIRYMDNEGNVHTTDRDLDWCRAHALYFAGDAQQFGGGLLDKKGQVQFGKGGAIVRKGTGTGAGTGATSAPDAATGRTWKYDDKQVERMDADIEMLKGEIANAGGRDTRGLQERLKQMQSFRNRAVYGEDFVEYAPGAGDELVKRGYDLETGAKFGKNGMVGAFYNKDANGEFLGTENGKVLPGQEFTFPNGKKLVWKGGGSGRDSFVTADEWKRSQAPAPAAQPKGNGVMAKVAKSRKGSEMPASAPLSERLKKERDGASVDDLYGSDVLKAFRETSQGSGATDDDIRAGKYDRQLQNIHRRLHPNGEPMKVENYRKLISGAEQREAQQAAQDKRQREQAARQAKSDGEDAQTVKKVHQLYDAAFKEAKDIATTETDNEDDYKSRLANEFTKRIKAINKENGFVFDNNFVTNRNPFGSYNYQWLIEDVYGVAPRFWTKATSSANRRRIRKAQ